MGEVCVLIVAQAFLPVVCLGSKDTGKPASAVIPHILYAESIRAFPGRRWIPDEGCRE